MDFLKPLKQVKNYVLWKIGALTNFGARPQSSQPPHFALTNQRAPLLALSLLWA